MSEESLLRTRDVRMEGRRGRGRKSKNSYKIMEVEGDRGGAIVGFGR